MIRRLRGWGVWCCGAIVALTLIAMAPAGAAPDSAQQAHSGTFGNANIAADWQVRGTHFTALVIQDRINHIAIPIAAPFALTLHDGAIDAREMVVSKAPNTVHLDPNPDAARLAERLPGQALEAEFVDASGQLRVEWRLVQRQGAQYLRQVVVITALNRAVPIQRVELLGASVPGAYVDGSVRGSPVVAGHDYLAFEYPMSKAEVSLAGKIELSVERKLPLQKGQSVTYSAVVGTTRPTQLRRDFATYIQRERAHPYRPFLHYESWYDLGFSAIDVQQPYTQAEALDRIAAFGTQLVADRHVKLSSFVFDDGWDSYDGNWDFSKYFPNGFDPVCAAAKKYGAAPGIWLSPWGGYDAPKLERVTNGRKLGYETVDGGFALSGPKYWRRFHQVVMTLLNHDCVNAFKFDGTGNVNSVYPGSSFDSDFAAAIELIHDIRAAKPKTFINLTTGTWASPFWLRYADSIWRGGEDHAFAGVGPMREQWITYRDEQTYRNIVEKGPLFPINSLMLHGIIYARYAFGLNTDPGHDFANEVHSFFASGTDLQGLLVTPSLMTPADWDLLAHAARWSRANAQVLEDVHWIGGDPGRLDVYGWAAWTPARAFITLRNPDRRPRVAIIDVARQLELEPGTASRFSVRNVWRTRVAAVPNVLQSGRPVALTLPPFAVLTLELTPSEARP